MISYCFSDGDIFDKIMKITNDANPLDRTTAKVITTVYYENFLNLPSLAHPTMMELLKRFKVFEGENYCLTRQKSAAMTISIGTTMHNLLVESLKQSDFVANIQIDGSDDVSTK